MNQWRRATCIAFTLRAGGFNPRGIRNRDSASKEGGKTLVCGPSLARLITAKLDARRVAGETLDKIASLQDYVMAFA